jgi:hypothetical protein
MSLPITHVVLYKHGVGHFERQGPVTGDVALSLTVRQAEVSDVLKSLTVLDLDGGHIASVSYDSTKPLAQLLQDVALSIPDQGSLVGLLPQIKGARVAVLTAAGRVEGILLGVDTTHRQSADGIIQVVLVSVLTDAGSVQQFDLHALAGFEVLDTALRRDLDYYLRTQLLAKKKDARTFTFFARGEGTRTVRMSYILESPVWKATYRILLGEEGKPPLIQGWAVVDNTQDEDWEEVRLSLIAGLPVSFVHDLYTPRYIRRPVIEVKETTGVLPPEVEEGVEMELAMERQEDTAYAAAPMDAPASMRRMRAKLKAPKPMSAAAVESSAPAQVRERKIGDLFEYEIEHPVTIRRNQSALVPIVLRPFEGRPVLLHNRNTRPQNPMRCVELKNTTGLTLEGGPMTVLEGGSYVGEAMLETLKPDEDRLIPYAVELSVHVLDNVDSFEEEVHKVVIREGRLTRHSKRVNQTTYTFDHKSEINQIVYLDHPREGGSWKLVDTPAPVQTTENYWRFRFELPAKQVTRFVVKAQMPIRQTQELASMDTKELGLWLNQKHVDAKSEKVLREVIAAQKRVAELDALLDRLETERDQIAREQERIRNNLKSLSDRSGEKELRERLVRTLNKQEDRLEQLSAEITARAAERDEARERVSALLGKLEYEGTM